MAGIVGIDIGGTWFRVGTVENDGSLSDFRKIPVKNIFRTADALGDLGDFLRDYMAGKTVLALAIGFPATLDRQRMRVLQAPSAPIMENLPVVEVLSRRFSLPVFIERDVTAALAYDTQALGIPEEGIVCGIYFGTGIGNAILINGRPLLGCHGTAGELGHICADGSDIPCGCSNTGCMEPLAGGKRLVELCRTVFPDTHIGDVFVEHAGHPEIIRFIDRMAMTVATEVNILDPHCVLIGGGVPNMQGFPRDLFLELLLKHTRKPLPAEDLRVFFTGDREEKCVLGSAMYAASQLKSNTKR